jgi:hypothetical protein
MKSSLMRPALALALALGLTACGGKASFTIAGTVTGLQYNGMKLSSNGQTIAVNPLAEGTPASGTVPDVQFSFPNSIEYGNVYDITFVSLPAHQTCSLARSSDTAGRLAEINAIVSCSLAQHAIQGTVTGLKSAGLVLTNGSAGGTVTVAGTTTTNTDGTTTTTYPDPISFTFATPVVYGQTYGVTVLTQPANDICKVANGTGTQGDADVVDNATTGTSGVHVTCSPKPAP